MINEHELQLVNEISLSIYRRGYEDGKNEKAAVSKQISLTDEIEIGDVVRHFNSLGIVVKVNKYHVCVLTIDRNYITVDKVYLEKTGSNFSQIEEILERIEHEDRQSKD